MLRGSPSPANPANSAGEGAGGGTDIENGAFDASESVGNAADAILPGGSAGAYCLGAARVTYPPRPLADEVPDADDDITLVGAMHTIDLGDREPGASPPTEYRTVGLDLDDSCTTEHDLGVGECDLPSWALGSVDGPGGIDNAVGSIIQEIRERVAGFGSESYTRQIQTGRISVLFRITNFNGQLSDDQIRVEVFAAAPFDAFSPDAGAPKWDGTDVWPVSSDSVSAGGIPRYFDDLAYMKDGTLVASLTTSIRGEVGFAGVAPATLEMDLTAAAVMCTLREGPAPDSLRRNDWEAECVLGGRWQTDHLLHQLSQFPDPLNLTGPLCMSSPSYAVVKPLVCRPTDTFTGIRFPGAVCDALSIGLRFTTKPARIGDVYVLSPPEGRCAPEFEPSRDSCATLGCPPGGCPEAGSGSSENNDGSSPHTPSDSGTGAAAGRSGDAANAGTDGAS